MTLMSRGLAVAVVVLLLAGCSGQVARGSGSPSDSGVDAVVSQRDSATDGPALHHDLLPDASNGQPDSAPVIPPGAIALATGQGYPFAIAADANNVYWLNLGTSEGHGKSCCGYTDGQVMKCAVRGCDNHPTVLATISMNVNDPATPGALVIDATNVYWVEPTTIRSCAIDGCNGVPTVIANSQNAATAVAVGGGSAYWTVYDLGWVGSSLLSSSPGTGTTLVSSQVGPTGIVADDSFIYWTAVVGTLDRCSLAGCGGLPTRVWSAPVFDMANPETNTNGLAMDADNLYWANADGSGGSVLQCAKSDCGGSLVTLATGRNAPVGIAVDATSVYWGEGWPESDAGVFACAIGGCGGTPKLVAKSGAAAVAVGSTDVYWAVMGNGNGQGEILMAPKP